MKTFQAKPVLYFVLLSYALAWLLALPLWLHGGTEHPYFMLIAVTMMGVPAVAATIVSKATDPNAALATSLGLTPWKPMRRTLRYCVFAVSASIFMIAAGLVVGAAFGLYHFDLQHLSGLAEVLRTKLAGNEAALAKLPALHTLALLQILLVLAATPLNAIAALGEELGWRGWLLPKLMPLGTLPAVLISGVIWGLWHAPVILLGYNYPGVPGWLALSCMTAMCVVLGAVLAWTRLRSGSVWPAALGHGAINAAASMHLLFGLAGEKLDLTQVTVLGWTGWLVPALLVFVLFYFYPANRGQTAKL